MKNFSSIAQMTPGTVGPADLLLNHTGGEGGTNRIEVLG